MVFLLSFAAAQEATWNNQQWDGWFADLEVQAQAVDAEASEVLLSAGVVAGSLNQGGATPEQVFRLDRSADHLVESTEGLADDLAAGASVLNSLPGGQDLVGAHSEELMVVAAAAVNGYTNANTAYAAVTAARLGRGGEVAAARKQIAHEMAYGDYIVHADVLFQMGYIVLVENEDSMASQAAVWCESYCDDPNEVLGFQPDLGGDDDDEIDSTSISSLGYRYVDTAGGVHQLHLTSYAFAGKTGGLEMLLNYHRGFSFKSNGFTVQLGPAVRLLGFRLAAGAVFDGYGKPDHQDYNLPASLGAYAHGGVRWSVGRFEVFGYGEPRWYRNDRSSKELGWADELRAEAGFGLGLGEGWIRLGAQRLVLAPGTFNAGTASWVRYF